MQSLVFYHNDLDGFASAWAHFANVGSDPTYYYSIQYGDAFPDMRKGQSVVFLDFCPTEDQLNVLLNEKKCRVHVIDHHKTSVAIVEKFKEHAAFSYVHDIDHSGCVLTWDYYNTEDIEPEGLLFIQDRDLWLFNLNLTKPFCTFMACQDRDFIVWSSCFDNIDRCVLKGNAMLQYQGGLVERMANGAVETDWMFQPHNKPSHRVMIGNVSILQSEVCHKLLDDNPHVDFVATYSTYKDKKTWQLRSRGDFDVAEIAKMNGGGGHKNASGFVAKTN